MMPLYVTESLPGRSMEPPDPKTECPCCGRETDEMDIPDIPGFDTRICLYCCLEAERDYEARYEELLEVLRADWGQNCD